MSRIGTILLLALLAAAPAGFGVTFDKYQAIIDRHPFGKQAEVAAAISNAAEIAAADSFIKDLKMTAIIQGEDGGGPRVGLLNTKTQKSYLLGAGDTDDGIELVEADYTKERAKLRKDTVERWIQMGGGTVIVPPAATASRFSPRPTSPSPPTGLRMPPLTFGTNRLAVRTSGYAQQRAEIMEQRRRRADEAAKASAAATGMTPEEQIKAYQMELIRAGGASGPPLPIPLTKDMDDQLVKEGVLPPQDESQQAIAPPSPVPTAPPADE